MVPSPTALRPWMTPDPPCQETRELEMIQQELRKADDRAASDDDMYPPVERMDTVAAVAGDDEKFVLSDDEAGGFKGGEDHGAHKPKSRKCGIGITFRLVTLLRIPIILENSSLMPVGLRVSNWCRPASSWLEGILPWSAVMECVPA